MDIVVDTSVVIASVINEPQKQALIAKTRGATLHAPASLDAEIGNAFSAMMKRRRVTLEQSQAAVKAYSQIPISLVRLDLSQALSLASQLNIYAYDAYVIVRAVSLKCPLLSLDGGLMQAARAVGVTVMELS